MKKIVMVLLAMVAIFSCKICTAQGFDPATCEQIQKDGFDCQCVWKLRQAIQAGKLSTYEALQLGMQYCRTTTTAAQPQTFGDWLNSFLYNANKAFQEQGQQSNNPPPPPSPPPPSLTCPICGEIGTPHVGLNGIYYTCPHGHSWR
jgi:hypothetical protein